MGINKNHTDYNIHILPLTTYGNATYFFPFLAHNSML